MERLTKRNLSGRAVFAKNAPPLEQAMDLPAIMERLAAYEDTGLEPCDYAAMKAALEQADTARKNLNELIHIVGAAGVDHLRELAQAKKDGRLVVLPCKVGTPVWWIETVIKSNGPGKWGKVKCIRTDEFCYEMLGWIDTPIYLTREAAEAALKGDSNNAD